MRTLESPDDNGLFNIPPHQRYNVACISLCYGTAHVHRGSACTTRASPLICPLVLRCCWRAHRPLSVCACCAAARVRTAPHLSARAAMLLACAPPLICLRVLCCCSRAAVALVLFGVFSLSPWAGSQLACELLRSAYLKLTCRPGPTANGWHLPAALGELNFKCENRKKTPSQSEIVHSENRFQPTGRKPTVLPQHRPLYPHCCSH